MSIIVLGVLSAVAGAGLGIASRDSGGPDEQAGVDGGRGRKSATGATTTSTAPTTTAPTAATPTTLYRMDLVVGPGGDFEVRMPDYWVSAPMGGDPAATAAEAFPDDPTKAAVLQVVLDNFAVPQSLVVLVDGQGLGAELVADMAFIERGDAFGADLSTVEGILQDSAVDVGRTIVGSGRVQSPLGETTWFESTFELSGVGTVHVIDYAAVVSGTVWKLTFWTDRMPQGRAVADEILATFALRA